MLCYVCNDVCMMNEVMGVSDSSNVTENRQTEVESQSLDIRWFPTLRITFVYSFIHSGYLYSAPYNFTLVLYFTPNPNLAPCFTYSITLYQYFKHTPKKVPNLTPSLVLNSVPFAINYLNIFVN